MLNSDGEIPWPLGMMEYPGRVSDRAGQLVLAFVTLTIIPAMLMFIVAQRHLVAGLTAGAVKG